MQKPMAVWRALGAVGRRLAEGMSAKPIFAPSMGHGRLIALVLLATFAVVLLLAPPAMAQGGYAESFVLTGLVERPKTFTQADLMTYPSTTLSVAFGAGQGFQTGRYTGVQLWDLLQEATVQLDPARNNDRLRKYVVVTGSDGYDAIFSLAELDPDFGAEIILVAYAKDGQPLPQDEGMARAVIGTDKRGGRLVSNVVRIEVRDVDSPPRGS